MFALLIRREMAVPDDLPALLARAYEFKEHADYRTSRLSDVSAVQAEARIGAATRFVDEIARLPSEPLT